MPREVREPRGEAQGKTGAVAGESVIAQRGAGAGAGRRCGSWVGGAEGLHPASPPPPGGGRAA